MFVNSGFFLACLFCLSILPGTGQTASAQTKPGISLKSSVDRNRIVLGEPFQLQIQLKYPEKTIFASLPELPDSIQHFDVLEELKRDTSISNGTYTLTYQYRLTSFDSGHWVIPSLAAVAGKNTFKSDTLGIDILMVPLEGKEYNDIRDIIEVESKPFDWKRWIAIGITALLALIGIWYYFKNRKKPVPVAEDFASKLSPFDQAMQSLQKLREENAVEKGNPKQFYSGIYDTMRVYLVRQYKLPVMSSTTGDILLRLKGTYLGTDEIARLASVLRVADAVKFAKYPSSVNEAKESLDHMEAVIRTLNTQKS